ncbi:MAG: hypothetical protein J0G99_00050, partial [Alphaproteobacteria bacterium]|nr:hypothetical protein [Alphaproteobacteria bacterium]
MYQVVDPVVQIADDLAQIRLVPLLLLEGVLLGRVERPLDLPLEVGGGCDRRAQRDDLLRAGARGVRDADALALLDVADRRVLRPDPQPRRVGHGERHVGTVRGPDGDPLRPRLDPHHRPADDLRFDRI